MPAEKAASFGQQSLFPDTVLFGNDMVPTVRIEADGAPPTKRRPSAKANKAAREAQKPLDDDLDDEPPF
jgi:hypothetical protein